MGTNYSVEFLDRAKKDVAAAIYEHILATLNSSKAAKKSRVIFLCT